MLRAPSSSLAQRQKKRLSFREPEVEGPSTQHTSLEDQAFQVVKRVGSAFSENEEGGKGNLFSALCSDHLQETNILDDCDPEEDDFGSSSASHSRVADPAFAGPLQRSSMRGPPAENGDRCAEEGGCREEGGAVRLLRYQLQQQTQQTQSALHQAQMLARQAELEADARAKAQEQNSELLRQNADLLRHMEQLFRQIEELETQLRGFEKDRRYARIRQDFERPHQRYASPLASNRCRLPSDDNEAEKLNSNPESYSATPRSPLPSVTVSMPQQTATPNSPKFATLAKVSNAKGNPDLHIGDMSPPIQTTNYNPFSTGWRPKDQDSRPGSIKVQPQSPTSRNVKAALGQTQSLTSRETVSKPQGQPSRNAKDTPTSQSQPARNRTGSFGAFSRLKPPENIHVFGATTSKKYSSSTSDLYGSPQTNKFFQDDPSSTRNEPSSTRNKPTAATNLSKLPRFQAYTGWHRRSSLTKDFDQMAKDKMKYSADSSMFNK